MSEAVGFDVDQKKNPTDVLVQFESGPCNGFLGLSAKATKGKTDIGFKNPGLGTIDKNLDLNLCEKYETQICSIVSKMNLPQTAKERKEHIRANSYIQKQTHDIGVKLLAEFRDSLYNRMLTMNQEDLKNYIIDDWMDAKESNVPYVKVTGFGNGTAEVCNPLDNPKLVAIKTQLISLHKVGNESIGVQAGDVKVCKGRFKFESEKMASSIKMSMEPW